MIFLHFRCSHLWQYTHSTLHSTIRFMSLSSLSQIVHIAAESAIAKGFQIVSVCVLYHRLAIQVADEIFHFGS